MATRLSRTSQLTWLIVFKGTTITNAKIDLWWDAIDEGNDHRNIRTWSGRGNPFSRIFNPRVSRKASQGRGRPRAIAREYLVAPMYRWYSWPGFLIHGVGRGSILYYCIVLNKLRNKWTPLAKNGLLAQICLIMLPSFSRVFRPICIQCHNLLRPLQHCKVNQNSHKHTPKAYQKALIGNISMRIRWISLQNYQQLRQQFTGFTLFLWYRYHTKPFEGIYIVKGLRLAQLMQIKTGPPISVPCLDILIHCLSN